MRILHKKTVMSFTILIGILFVGFPGVALAVSAEYTQSYKSDQDLAFGSLVSLKDNSGDTVELTNLGNAKNFLGVSVGDESATVSINKKPDESQVAISGNVVALVSDITGSIKSGDLLVGSVIEGVAGKIGENGKGTVVGVATANFDPSNTKNTTTTIRLSDGTTKKVVIGPLPIDLFAIKNGVEPKPDLIGWVERVSGKPVSTLKITVALILTVMLVGSVTAMAYSAIRNTIVQSSRNPLARPVIMRTLLRVCIIIATVTLAGVVVIYAVLRA